MCKCIAGREFVNQVVVTEGIWAFYRCVECGALIEEWESTMLNKKQVQKALDWLESHRIYVDRICQSEEDSFPPTGEDANNPNWWKAAHWIWFFIHLGKLECQP